MTAKAKEQAPIYGVVIYRKDEKNIIAMESEDFAACMKLWESLHTQWTEAHQQGKPFILKAPEITAFEPGLISEIILKPKMMLSGLAEHPDNPYYKQMQQKGLMNTLQAYAKPGIDLLDEGYNT